MNEMDFTFGNETGSHGGGRLRVRGEVDCHERPQVRPLDRILHDEHRQAAVAQDTLGRRPLKQLARIIAMNAEHDQIGAVLL